MPGNVNMIVVCAISVQSMCLYVVVYVFLFKKKILIASVCLQ